MTSFERAIAPLAVFTIVTGVASVALDILQDLTGFAAGYIALAAFGPAIGAVATWLSGAVGATLRPGRAPTEAGLQPPAVSRRQTVAHLILGVAASVVFALLLWGAFVLFGGSPAVPAESNGVPIAVTAVGLLVACALQELGWRATLQPLLEHTGSRLLASVVTGAVWGFWVVQLYPMQNTPIAVGGAVFATIGFSILLGYLGNGSTGQRIAATTFVHWLMALALLLVAGDGPLSVSAALAWLSAIAVTTGVFIAMFVAAQRKRAAAAV